MQPCHVTTNPGSGEYMSKADLRRLDPEFVRQIILDLCVLWEQSKSTTIFREGIDEERAIAITTQAHHAVRMARAVLILDGFSSGIEMVPSVRLIMECGVTAAWLLLTPGSGHALKRDGAENRKKAIEHLMRVDREYGEAAVEGVGPGYRQALRALEELEGAEGPKSFIFEQRCKALYDGEGLYVLYRVLSAESHAGLGIEDYYLVEDPDSPIGISFDPDAPNEFRVSVLGIAAAMLFLALNAEDHARVKPRHSTQLRRAAKRIGVPVDIRRKDGSGLPEH